MGSNNNLDDFQRSLEPVVMINEDAGRHAPRNDSLDKNRHLQQENRNNTKPLTKSEESEVKPDNKQSPNDMNNMMNHPFIPHFAGMPLLPPLNIPFEEKRPKNEEFEKEYSPPKEDGLSGGKKVRSVQRTPRSQIRHVSPAEAAHAEQTYSKRKSQPLEKCPICKKYFRRMRTHLSKHEIRSRDPNDPLSCSVCAKSFSNQSNLQIHMRSHTGDKPFVCDYCKKSFTQISNLTNHVRTHTGQKPFKCPHCDRSFKQSGNLKNHIRSHTGDKPFVCDICHKSFTQSCNLTNHVRTHTGEKPFKCPHCERSFTQSGNLTNHIRLHTDEKPFKCHFCDKAFVQSGNLNSHIKNNHKFTDSLSNEIVNRMQ